MNIAFDWNEVDSLITLLRAKGISYLVGDGSSVHKDGDDECVDAVYFLQRLAACGYPLVENASISLFILHPDLAPSVVEALQQSTGDIHENIAVVTLATLYLQQWWFFRLTFALGSLPSFPEALFVPLWEERGLPSPRYGLPGLMALQEYQQRRYSISLNFLDDWQNQMNHLLAQEEAYHRELSTDLKETLVELSASKKELHYYEHATTSWTTRNRALSCSGRQNMAVRTIISRWGCCAGPSRHSSWTNT